MKPQMLQDVEFSTQLLVVLLIKLVMTAISLGSGLVAVFCASDVSGCLFGIGWKIKALLPAMSDGGSPAYAMGNGGGSGWRAKAP